MLLFPQPHIPLSVTTLLPIKLGQHDSSNSDVESALPLQVT